MTRPAVKLDAQTVCPGTWRRRALSQPREGPRRAARSGWRAPSAWERRRSGPAPRAALQRAVSRVRGVGTAEGLCMEGEPGPPQGSESAADDDSSRANGTPTSPVWHFDCQWHCRTACKHWVTQSPPPWPNPRDQSVFRETQNWSYSVENARLPAAVFLASSVMIALVLAVALVFLPSGVLTVLCVRLLSPARAPG